MKMSVSLTSWGEHCGPKPKGYASNKARPVEIVSQGKHLVFTKGGLRTDRCQSPNPRLSSRSEAITASSWKRVCETSKDDPKYERGEYLLVAAGNNRLEYTAKTKVDWTLKGDHCVANLTEKRVFERERLDTEDPWSGLGSKKVPEPEGKSAEGGGEVEEARLECENPGEMRKLVIQPREIRIGPGEKICLKALGIDAGGCRFPVTASWKASQGGQEVGGLISRTGCFTAGATAADAEGSYDIEARASGKSGAATVTVAFPDLGDLLRARLDPTRELDESPEGEAPPANDSAQTPAPGPPPVAAPAATGQATGDGDNTMLLVIILGSALLLATGLLVAVLVIRRKSRYEEDDTWLDDEPRSVDSQAPPPAAGRDPHRPSQPAQRSPAPRDGKPDRGEVPMVCPTCNETFPPGSRFCPADASALIPASEGGGEDENSHGMICPKCHRGYDPGAKFCPHDAQQLVPYPVWRNQRKGS